jgi:hypothetical protein
MSYPKFCRDCQYSKPEERSEWNLRCHHPNVNCKDEWALTSVKNDGSSAVDERKIKWFATCGREGKLYEPRT